MYSCYDLPEGDKKNHNATVSRHFKKPQPNAKPANKKAGGNGKKEDSSTSGGVRSSSGKGTITKTTYLGWAFNPKKADPKGCFYTERASPLRKSQQQPELGAKSFDAWVALGYRVSKGQKSHSRGLDGKPLFAQDQVWFVPPAKRERYLAPQKPSGLEAEVLERIERKKDEAENAHLHIPADFKPAEQTFDEDDSPPW